MRRLRLSGIVRIVETLNTITDTAGRAVIGLASGDGLCQLQPDALPCWLNSRVRAEAISPHAIKINGDIQYEQALVRSQKIRIWTYPHSLARLDVRTAHRCRIQWIGRNV